jgi:hypothetical protein
MKIALILCTLIFAGCATTELPKKVSDRSDLVAPISSAPTVTPWHPKSQYVQLLDSRSIRKLVRQGRDVSALSLNGKAKTALYVAGIAVASYILIKSAEDDDDSPSCLGFTVCDFSQ